MNKVILILLALVAVQASATPVKMCDTGAIDSKSVTIENCAKPPCKVKRGQIVKYTVKYTPTSTLHHPMAMIKAVRWGITMKFLDGSACGKIFRVSDDSPAPCPLKPGIEYIYKDAFQVPTFLPVNQGIVTGTLKSGSKTLLCMQFPALVQ